MAEIKKRLNVSIPVELYSKVTASGYGLTVAIIKGLELFLAPKDSDTKQESNSDILQLQEFRIRELQAYNETLKKELEDFKTQDTDTKQENNSDILQLQETRISELQEHIKVKDSQQEARAKELQEQIKIKDNQIEVKDNQIEKLTETMHAQSVHIQTLLNQKSIEAPGAKKPWWRFW